MIKKGVTILIIGLFLILRFVGFEDKMTFHLDQGLHLLETKEMVDSGKIRLVGPMVTSKTFLDRGFFIGPQYYYVLAIVGVITKWNPLTITEIMVLVELAVFISFWAWISKRWGWWAGTVVGFGLAVSPYLIVHSRFFWNPHMLLWTSMLATIVLGEWNKSRKFLLILILGILWGIGFGFHYSAVFWALPIGLVLIKNIKKIGWGWWGLPIGFVIGDLPYIVFELRHNFYNIRTFFWVMSQSSKSTQMEAHYIIGPLLGFAIVGIIYMLYKIKSSRVRLALTIVILVASYWGQTLLYKNQTLPLGHPEGWTYKTEKTVVEKILKNGCPKNYNVASTISGDTRSYDLRFLLSIKSCPPMGVENYPSAKKLFLVAPPDRPPETETVWEVNSLGGVKEIRKDIINERIIFYELEKK